MTEETLSLALQLGGQAEQAEILRPLCRAAQEELAGRLRPGIVPEDCGAVFPLAAAYLALAGLCAAGQTGAIESFTAGDVTIRQNGGTTADHAAALREQAARLLAPWSVDSGFFFQKVMG